MNNDPKTRVGNARQNSNASGTGHAAEHRRYPRYPVRLDALVTPEGLPSRRALIRNFCDQGMLVTVEDADRHPTGLEPGQNITIQFSVARGKGRQKFRLAARLVRRSDTALGVFFQQAPPGVLEALQQCVEHAGCDSFQDLPLPARQKQALESATYTVSERIDTVLKGFWGQCEKKLVEAAGNAQSNAFEAAYLDAIPHLRAAKDEVENRFRSSLQYKIDSPGGPEQIDDVDASQRKKDLSLLDQTEFEDWLAASETAARIEDKFEDQLRLIGSQLAAVTGFEASGKQVPLAPSTLCENFRLALHDVELENQVKRVIYQALEEVLNARLNQVYEALSQALPVRQPAPGEACTAETLETEEAGRIPDRQESNEAEAEAGHPPPPLPPQTGEIEPEPHQTTSFLETAARFLALAHGGKDDHPSSRGPSEHNPTSPAPATGMPAGEWQTQELLAAVSALEGLDHRGESRSGDQTVLEKKLLKALATPGSLQAVSGGKRGNAVAVSLQMLEALRNNTQPLPEIAPLLEKLQLPLFLLSLQEPAFLNSERHPAHEVLNLLEQIGGAIGPRKEQKNLKLQEILDRLIDRVRHEVPENPAVFSEVSKELAKLNHSVAGNRKLNEKRVVDSSEGRQRLTKAKRVVREEISKHIGGGKTVPKVVVDLLAAGWHQSLVTTELWEGRDSQRWQDRIGVIGRLVDWLSDQDRLSEVPAATLQSTLDVIDEELETVCSDPSARAKVMRDLTDCLIGTGNPPVRTRPGFVRIKTAPLTEEMPPAVAQRGPLARLRLGDWLLFSRGKERTEPLKLLWIGTIPAVYVFVDRQGTKRLELAPEQLAEQLRSSQATPMENLDLPLSRRTTDSVLEKLYDRLRDEPLQKDSGELINLGGLVRLLQQHCGDTGTAAHRHTLAYLELIDYQIVSQSSGHEAGNALVKEVCTRIEDKLEDRGLLAQANDQTLALFLPDCPIEQGENLLRELVASLSGFVFSWEDKSYPLGLNTGVTGFSGEITDVQPVLQEAAVTCASAKASGRNTIKIFDENDEHLRNQERLVEWAGRIDHLLQNDRLVLVCQEIRPVQKSDRQKPHYEVLLRLHGPGDELLSPFEFLSAVEQLKRMPDIDRHVVTKLFAWLQRYRSVLRYLDGVSVNLSAQSINQPGFLEFIKAELLSSGLPPQVLTFEITETVAIDNFDEVARFIRHLKRFGCTFSLDDFGSGYASYSYLKNLDVDFLKIDGIFVKEMHRSPKDRAMVKSMNEIGHCLGLKTIAEFVENDAILNNLKELKVNYAQGYCIGRPVPLGQLPGTGESSCTAPPGDEAIA